MTIGRKTRKLPNKYRRTQQPLVSVQRNLVLMRCKGRCERCGKALSSIWECHHRKLRSQGGTWSLSNLIALHPGCHNAGSPGSVHDQPASSYAKGWLVKSHAEPAETPMLLHDKRWVLLTPDGSYRDSEDPR